MKRVGLNNAVEKHKDGGWEICEGWIIEGEKTETRVHMVNDRRHTVQRNKARRAKKKKKKVVEKHNDRG
jgi:hypothetical protein